MTTLRQGSRFSEVHLIDELVRLAFAGDAPDLLDMGTRSRLASVANAATAVARTGETPESRPDLRVALAAMHLQWFAAEDEGRTEEPTEHKIQKAREDGKVAKSPRSVESNILRYYSAVAQ